MRKNYKQNSACLGMGKRAQTTIFIIVAIVIVVAGILIYMFVPGVQNFITGESSPNAYIVSCLDEEIDEGIATLSKQGGYASPEGSVMYGGNNIAYLCYTAQYYKPCVVQQPMIKTKFEEELEGMVKGAANDCLRMMVEEYEGNGYSVSAVSSADVEVKIDVGEVAVNVKAPVTVSKESTETYEEFKVVRDSNLYDLLMMTTTVIAYESTYGDSETIEFLNYYPNLDFDKIKLGDGTTIYTVGDVVTGEDFTFASRSLAWPGGYGFEA